MNGADLDAKRMAAVKRLEKMSRFTLVHMLSFELVRPAFDPWRTDDRDIEERIAESIDRCMVEAAKWEQIAKSQRACRRIDRLFKQIEKPTRKRRRRRAP